MDRKQLRQAIRKAKAVYVNVRVVENDCIYVQAVKSSVLAQCQFDANYNAEMHAGELYID